MVLLEFQTKHALSLKHKFLNTETNNDKDHMTNYVVITCFVTFITHSSHTPPLPELITDSTKHCYILNFLPTKFLQ